MGRIVLGITGSIAAFKAASLCTALRKDGHEVQVVMTRAAQQFTTAVTMRALSGRPVVTDLFIDETAASLVHISLAEWMDLLLIAPATANILGKIWAGIADDVLSCVAMACPAPILIAPAMNDRMWLSPATQRNVAELKARGLQFIGPEEGRLASGKVSVGRLAPVEDVVEFTEKILSERGGQ